MDGFGCPDSAGLGFADAALGCFLCQLRAGARKPVACSQGSTDDWHFPAFLLGRPYSVDCSGIADSLAPATFSARRSLAQAACTFNFSLDAGAELSFCTLTLYSGNKYWQGCHLIK